MTINILHWCLVRCWSFAGTHRLLAGLFTFLSRQPVVNRLRANGRNWFRIITTAGERKKSEFSVLSYCDIMLSCKMWLSHMQMNGMKLVMRPETDVGNELPLILFDVTYPDLDKLSKLMCSDNHFTPQHQRDKY